MLPTFFREAVLPATGLITGKDAMPLLRGEPSGRTAD